jgi:hypothetical protein
MSHYIRTLESSSALSNQLGKSEKLSQRTELPNVGIIDIGPAACGLKDLKELHRMQQAWPRPLDRFLRVACLGHSVSA